MLRLHRSSRRGSRSSFVALTLLLGLSSGLATAPLALGDARAEPVDGLPEGVPERLAEILVPSGHRVTIDDGGVVEFWFRPEVPLVEPSGEFNVEYSNLASGLFIGIARIESAFSDYKKIPIPPGLYTLRYGVQPADGDHTGQTYFRDFVMMLPVEQDTFEVDGVEDIEPVVEASKLATGKEHPAVMGLYMIYDEVEETSVIRNDFDKPTLAVVMPDIVLGLVVEGHGEELTV